MFSLHGLKVKGFGLDESQWLVTVVPVFYFKGIDLFDVFDADVILFSKWGTP